jgi:hypothetical protein
MWLEQDGKYPTRLCAGRSWLGHSVLLGHRMRLGPADHLAMSDQPDSD